jgi:hypothetical protein
VEASTRAGARRGRYDDRVGWGRSGDRTGSSRTGDRSPLNDGGGGAGDQRGPPGGPPDDPESSFQMKCHSSVPRITGPNATKKLST